MAATVVNVCVWPAEIPAILYRQLSCFSMYVLQPEETHRFRMNDVIARPYFEESCMTFMNL